MSSDFEIRIYNSADQASVIELWRAVFPDGAAWNQAGDVIARKMSVQPDLFFVATENEKVVGTVVAGYDGVRGWVHRLAVHREHRRRGVATKLMRCAETALKERGCPKLNLQVRASNLEVLGFYRSLGYAVEDRASLGKPL